MTDKRAWGKVEGRPFRIRFLKGALAALLRLPGMLFFFGFGCAHYQLGEAGALPFRTLRVNLVENESSVPQAEALMTQNLVEAFFRDGALRIVQKGDAEAVLEVALSDYGRKLSATQESDTLLGRSFRLSLEATVSLIDNRTGDPYFRDRRFIVNEDAFIDGGLQQAEYQILPVMAREMARKIKNSVVGVW